MVVAARRKGVVRSGGGHVTECQRALGRAGLLLVRARFCCARNCSEVPWAVFCTLSRAGAAYPLGGQVVAARAPGLRDVCHDSDQFSGLVLRHSSRLEVPRVREQCHGDGFRLCDGVVSAPARAGAAIVGVRCNIPPTVLGPIAPDAPGRKLHASFWDGHQQLGRCGVRLGWLGWGHQLDEFSIVFTRLLCHD